MMRKTSLGDHQTRRSLSWNQAGSGIKTKLLHFTKLLPPLRRVAAFIFKPDQYYYVHVQLSMLRLGDLMSEEAKT